MESEEIGEIKVCYDYMHKEIRHRGLIVNSLGGSCRIVPLVARGWGLRCAG